VNRREGSAIAGEWISLLIGGILLLVGFAASLVFERYRVPDFFLLLLLGVVLGHVPFEPLGPGMVSALAPILPAFIGLTLAMIMFEGGLSLNVARAGSGAGALAAHILGAMALTMALTWFLATAVLGLSSLTGIVLAAAFSGPSATIVLSFAPHIGMSPRALQAIVLEGVIGNVVAAVVVLVSLQLPGSPGPSDVMHFLSQVGLSASVASLVALAWRSVTGTLLPFKFQYIATIALAVVVFALAEGIVGGNGAIAAFVFGLVISYRRDGTEAMAEMEGGGLKDFHQEITFGLRTFFFVYLGLLIQFSSFSPAALFGAGLLVVAFVIARVPTSIGLARSYRLNRRDTRVVIATVGRGMTDVVLVLLALQSGLLPPSEEPLLLGLLPLVILLAAVACAGLLAWSERAQGSAELPPDKEDIYRA
jgi:cell volume regulation protein A